VVKGVVRLPSFVGGLNRIVFVLSSTFFREFVENYFLFIHFFLSDEVASGVENEARSCDEFLTPFQNITISLPPSLTPDLPLSEVFHFYNILRFVYLASAEDSRMLILVD
jgi:hypothetical protein